MYSSNNFIIRIDRESINVNYKSGNPTDGNEHLVDFVNDTITTFIDTSNCSIFSSDRIRTFSKARVDVYTNKSNYYGQVHSLTEYEFKQELEKYKNSTV